MKKLIQKLIFWLFGESIYKIEMVEQGKLQDWLFTSFKDKGYAQYYTMRKKYITNAMSVGISHEDYLIFLGRIQELRSLNQNINQEVKRREAIKKKTRLEKKVLNKKAKS